MTENLLMSSTNPTTIMVTKSIEAGYTRTLRLCQDCPTAFLEMPVLARQWSVKDVIGHLAAWVRRCAIVLDHAHSTDGPLAATPDEPGLTQEFYLERKQWSWSEVETDFKAAHETLLLVIRRLPPGRINNRLVQRIVAHYTWEHYAEHWPELESWLQGVTRQNTAMLA
ncbi:MAG TPA: ClbS/DfsB family four-helix bundle protein [Anaerolineae bacterium]|nr:ClbS/DfsB family four-helix bundle protein [Anaerolineae bacterium]HMR66056.1 ClbS/DfsB family four-helix bundle protein [Anaerolineae bacterium]